MPIGLYGYIYRLRAAGADPGFRRGGFVHSEGGGGGGSYRNFRSGSKLLQGPGQINKQKKIADSRRGGGRSPKKTPCIRAWAGLRFRSKRKDRPQIEKNETHALIKDSFKNMKSRSKN